MILVWQEQSKWKTRRKMKTKWNLKNKSNPIPTPTCPPKSTLLHMSPPDGTELLNSSSYSANTAVPLTSGQLAASWANLWPWTQIGPRGNLSSLAKPATLFLLPKVLIWTTKKSTISPTQFMTNCNFILIQIRDIWHHWYTYQHRFHQRRTCKAIYKIIRP